MPNATDTEIGAAATQMGPELQGGWAAPEREGETYASPRVILFWVGLVGLGIVDLAYTADALTGLGELGGTVYLLAAALAAVILAVPEWTATRIKKYRASQRSPEPMTVTGLMASGVIWLAVVVAVAAIRTVTTAPAESALTGIEWFGIYASIGLGLGLVGFMLGFTHHNPYAAQRRQAARRAKRAARRLPVAEEADTRAREQLEHAKRRHAELPRTEQAAAAATVAAIQRAAETYRSTLIMHVNDPEMAQLIATAAVPAALRPADGPVPAVTTRRQP